MKTGNRVTLVDAKGKEHAATVIDVVDTGASGYKMLDLSFEGGRAERVPHRGDEQGKGFWLLETETKTPPERRAPLEAQPAALAEAEAAGALPVTDRRNEGSTRTPGAHRKRS